MSVPISSPQAFYLRLNNHHGFITGALTDLYNDQSMVDVTLSAEGETIRAHRVVLSACSSYFKSILSPFNNCSQYPVIIIKDVPFVDLKAIVEFIYRGEITVPREQLDSLLKNGGSLQIKGLADVNKKRTIDGDISNYMKDYDDKDMSDGPALSNTNGNANLNGKSNGRRKTRKMIAKVNSGKNDINKVDDYDSSGKGETTPVETPPSSTLSLSSDEANDENVPAKVAKLFKDETCHSGISNKEATESGESESGTSHADDIGINCNAPLKCVTIKDEHIAPFNMLEQSMMIYPRQDVELESQEVIANQLETPLINDDSRIKTVSSEVHHFNDPYDDIPLALIAPQTLSDPKCGANPTGDGSIPMIPPKLRISRAGIPRKGTSSRSQKKYKCPVCHKVYVSPQNMKEHLRNTHTNPNEKYVCQECGNEYSWKHALDRHFKSKHK